MVTARTRERRRKPVEQPEHKTNAIAGWCTTGHHAFHPENPCPKVTGNNTCSCWCHTGQKPRTKNNKRRKK